jgi:hypothetical protein
MRNGTVISFHTAGGSYLDEISKFWCATRPVVGEIWYIPLGEYPFQDNELKERFEEFVSVKILEVRVVPYPLGRPGEPATMVLCEIIDNSSPYEWKF